MKMSKKYKALLLSAVLMTLGGNAFASYEYGETTYDSLWNVGGANTTFTDWDVTVDPSDAKSGLMGRDDGKTLTFAGGSITSSSAQIFEAGDYSNSNSGTINFGTEDKPLTSFYVKKLSVEGENSDTWTVGRIYGANSVVNIYANEYKQDQTGDGLYVNKGTLHVDVGEFTAATKMDEIYVCDGGKVDIQADTFTSTSENYGVYSGGSDSSVTIDADTVDITSTGTSAIYATNYWNYTTPGNVASVNITADTINLKSTSTTGRGVKAMRDGLVTLSGDTTIVAVNAINAYEGSTVNVNTDGLHTTVMQGDIVFGNSNLSDTTNINANVNVNLTGSDSSWTGSAYQQYSGVSHGTDVNGKVTGFDLTIADGAEWDMTDSSFVNTATVNGGAINVSSAVTMFNADTVTLTGGEFNAEGGTTTINTFNASGNSKVNLKNTTLQINGGTADVAEFNASGGSSVGLSDATLNMASGEANLKKITLAGASTLGVGSGATVNAERITSDGNNTLNFASGSNVTADLYFDTGTSGDTSTKVNAQGNFSGKFLDSDGNNLSEAAVQKILGFTSGAASSQQLQKDSYMVSMDVGNDGNFSLQTTDTSGVSDGGSVKTHQLGTWDASGNYTAYGTYDANHNDISNVGTLSAKAITLNDTDLATTLDAKANVDASNIGSNRKDADGNAASETDQAANKDAWGKALGGTVSSDSEQLVTGKTVYGAIQKELDDAIGGKYNSTNNIVETDNVKASIGKLDAAVGQVSKVGGTDDGIMDKHGHLIGSSESGYKANLTDAVLAVDEKVGNLNTNNEFRDTDNNLIGTYNVLDSKESLANNLEFIDHALGTTADGAYVSSGNSVGQNLNALDQGLSNLDRGLSDLGDRLNKVGAGAAALAALHPEGFDPDDKLSFAVGYGHYKNANASAIGAFYKPNEDVTFSVASTVGNGNTMLNAGVSFKLGKSAHVEKAVVAKADYDALQQKVAAQDKEIEELKKQMALLMAKG